MKRKKIKLKDETCIVIRPLRISDQNALGNYFLTLSEQTKSLFCPHTFDRETAKKICNETNTDILRIVAIHTTRIVGYFILLVNLLSSVKERHEELNENETCTIAPSVIDDFQSRGLGTQMLLYSIDIARQLGKKKMVLYGGVLTNNHRALCFYKKFGFTYLGKFESKLGKSLDMALEL